MSATGTMKFRVLKGQHIIGNGTQPDGKPIDKVFNPGDVIESDIDLAAKHGREKFEALNPQWAQSDGALKASQAEVALLKSQLAAMQSKVQPEATASAQPAHTVPPRTLPGNIDKLNAQDLKRYAENEEIPVGNAKSREELLAVIRASVR